MDILKFLFFLALIEGLVKPVVVFLVQSQIRRYLPIVLDRIDPWLPIWSMTMTEDELRERVIDVIFDVSADFGESISQEKAEQILISVDDVYSFLQNAKKRL